MTSHIITDVAFAAVLAAARADAETEIRAQNVRYVADSDALEIVTDRHAAFLVPRSRIEALQGVPVEALPHLAVWPDGSASELDDLDIHIGVDGLMAAFLPAMLPTWNDDTDRE